jgi:hypothetical protein
MEIKVCTRCDVEQPIAEFYKRKQAKDGRQSWCRGCIIRRNRNLETKIAWCPCVYFIEAEGLDKIKVGVTNKLKKRMRAIQTGCPVPIKVLAFLRFETYKKAMEMELHLKEVFMAYRSHGEWFHAIPQMRSLITRIIESEPPVLTDAKIDAIFKV